MTDDHALSQASGQRPAWGIAIASAIAMLVALVAVWPYQSGHFDERQSLLSGLVYIATKAQGGEWIFCLFVPFISVFLIYLQRHRLRGVPLTGANAALVLFLGAAALYWLGYKADTRYPGFIAIQLMLAALVVWFAGWRLMVALFLPWLFFSFTWPLLPLESILAFPLRVLTAKVSTGFLDAVGIDAVRQGTGIVSAADPVRQIPEGARFSLDVATPCSGIRSLFSLMMISAFYSFIALEGTWKRLALFASSIPLAMLGNFVRTVMLTVGSLLFGPTFAIGEGDRSSAFHTASGFVVFAVALVGMFALARLLESTRSRKKKDKHTGAKPGDPPLATTKAPPVWRSATVLVIGAATLGICALTPVSTALTEPGLSRDFPLVLGAYAGEDRPMTKNERDVFPEGVELTRHLYHGPANDILATIVVSGAVKRSLHEPEVCLPGQGWTIDDRHTLEIDIGGQKRNAMFLALHRDTRSAAGIPVRYHAYNIYWYEGFGVSTPSYQEHIVLTHVDNIFRNINHRWSMASFFTQLPPEPVSAAAHPKHDETVATLKAFIDEFAPHVVNEPRS